MTPHTTAMMAEQIARDVMTLRGPGETGGYMTTADPAQYMTAERLTLARKFAALVPRGAVAADVPRLATKIAAAMREEGKH